MATGMFLVLMLLIVPGPGLESTKTTPEKVLANLLAELVGRIKMLEHEVSKIKTLEDEVTALKQQVPQRAFIAWGSQKDIPANGIIKFGNLRMKQNVNYNPASSIFTCQDRGLYYFFVTISAYHGKGYEQVWYDIVQDGTIRGSGVTGHGDDGPVGTHFALIRCHPGSHIWVKQGGFFVPDLKQAVWALHSQFGGFQIAP